MRVNAESEGKQQKPALPEDLWASRKLQISSTINHSASREELANNLLGCFLYACVREMLINPERLNLLFVH